MEVSKGDVVVVTMVLKVGALAGAVALMTGCASDHPTDADLVSSLPPNASAASSAQSESLPPGLLGCWSGAAILTLDDCIVGEECERLERVDDNKEHCWYTLTSLGREANGYGFKTSGGNSFGCGWSPWAMGPWSWSSRRTIPSWSSSREARR
jgi:hypothetical protein